MAALSDAAEPQFWMVRAKSAIVRAEISTASALVCELRRSRLVATVERVALENGTMRLRMVEPCAGWLSEKVLAPVAGVALGALDARNLVEVRRAGRKGDGVFARGFIAEGRYVGDYEGEVCSTAEVDRRYPDGDNEYLYALADGRCVDATRSTHFSHWINHSSGGYNLTTRTEELPAGAPRVAIYATRDIEPGDELNFDYGTDFFTSETDEVVEDVYAELAAKRRREAAADAAAAAAAPEPTEAERRRAFDEAMGRADPEGAAAR